MTEAALSAHDVRRALGGADVLCGASLALKPGKITALLGPSGAGKSTLLRVLAGLEPVDGGEVRNGVAVLTSAGGRVAPEKRGVGVVFQDFALFPHLDALDNVAFGLNAMPRPERRLRARALLETVALADRAHAFPHELSGGEQQRVALARALAPAPDVILMDEPFSNLDGELRRVTRDRTRQILAGSGAAVLLVTHDVEEAMSLADELALMAEGRVIQTGAPADVYLNPLTPAAARLTGEINLWTGRVIDGQLDTPFSTFPADGVDEGAQAVAMVRPEAIVLLSGGDLIAMSSRPAGAFARVEIAPETGEPMWRARVPLADAPEAGERVSAVIDPNYVRVTPV